MKNINDVISDMRGLAALLNDVAKDLETVSRLFAPRTNNNQGDKQADFFDQSPKDAPDLKPLKIKNSNKLTKQQKEQVRLLWKQAPESGMAIHDPRALAKRQELAKLYQVPVIAVSATIYNAARLAMVRNNRQKNSSVH